MTPGTVVVRTVGPVTADLILTGRPVTAGEALNIGLVNRTVPPGTALDAAVALATEIAGFPQTCLRHDRLSMLEQAGLTEDQAMLNEFRRGTTSSAAGAVDGAARFAAGSGRHGSFG